LLSSDDSSVDIHHVVDAVVHLHIAKFLQENVFWYCE
jgi:hypothetical protein